MQDSTIGGRRRGEPLLSKKPVPPNPVSAQPTPEKPAYAETVAPSLPAKISYPYAPKATPEEIAAYRAREKELLAAYKLSPGKCPLCSRLITKGIVGHLSICIRRNSNTNSS